MKSTTETAISIKALLVASNQTRARISGKAIERIAEVNQEADEHLSYQYMTDLISQLANRGIMMGQLGAGGHGLILTSSLSGAKWIGVEQ